jgi:glycosyltransferase-like protein LARGE
MNLDVDFYLCTDLRANIDRLPSEYKAMLASGKVAFVVPAFEFTKSAVELEAENYPSKKDELLKYAEKQELVMFHNQWKRGHGPTDYNKWYSADKPYKVVDYNYNYEPYVLTKRENVPWCDERFVGYGSNKAACLYEIFLAGIEFYVLPNDFLIHQRHPYPENDRRIERKYNKRLYDAFREEACFRYSRMSLGQANETFIDERICGKSFPSHFNL